MFIANKGKKIVLIAVLFCFGMIAPFIGSEGNCGSVAAAKLLRPQITSAASSLTRVNVKPMLRWAIVPGAVSYEVEFLSGLPENPRGTDPSAKRLFSAVSYTNGYNADLTAFAGKKYFGACGR